MNETNEEIKSCARCGKKLSIMTEDGKHNFCPTSTDDNRIIEICMSCKMAEGEKREELH